VPDNGGLARSNLQYHRRRPVPDREIRRLIVADTISDIHPRSRGTYAGATPPATARSYWIAVRLMELRGERATLGLLASSAPSETTACDTFWARIRSSCSTPTAWATAMELVGAMADYIDNFYNVEATPQLSGRV
jgi:hypothetical protein